MGIPLWESPSSKAADKPSASTRCNTLPAGTWFDPIEFTAESPSAESGQRVVIDLTGEEASNPPPPAALATAGTTGTTNTTGTTGATNTTGTTGTTNTTGTTGATNTTGTTGTTTTTSRRRDGTSTMLTLDEFLRETSLMTAATNEAERRLQLMLVQRRGERERERERERDTPSSLAEAQWRRSFFDQMPARLLQFGVAPGTGSGAATANHTPLPPAPEVSSPAAAAAGPSSHRTAAGTVAPPTATDRSGAPSSLDYFDSLANRIQRIGALQDAMMGSVRSTDPTFEEILSGAMARMPVQEPTAEPNQSDRGRNVESLRIREARLRTMQTRVDLLANEFALLRNTRREMRRVIDLENARRGLREVRTALGLVEDELGIPRRSNPAGPPDRSIARQSFLQRNPETNSGSSRDQISPATAAAIARLRAQSGVLSTAAADVQGQSPDAEQSASATTPTPQVESIDRRSPLMTQEQRDLLLRDEVMLMQIERMQNGL